MAKTEVPDSLVVTLTGSDALLEEVELDQVIGLVVRGRVTAVKQTRDAKTNDLIQTHTVTVVRAFVPDGEMVRRVDAYMDAAEGRLSFGEDTAGSDNEPPF